MVRIYENVSVKLIGQLLLFVSRINRCVFLASFMDINRIEEDTVNNAYIRHRLLSRGSKSIERKKT